MIILKGVRGMANKGEGEGEGRGKGKGKGGGQKDVYH